MYARLTSICNELASLGKVYSESEKVQKILRSLPKKWSTKVTAIKEAKDLRTLKIEELLGNLMTYELETLGEMESEHPRRHGHALAIESDEDSSSGSESDIDEEDLAMVAKKFKKFFKPYRKGGIRSRKGAKNRSGEREKKVCFLCGKKGHFVAECSMKKKEKKNEKDEKENRKEKKKEKKKAYKASWDDSSSSEHSDDEEDHKANLCLVANEFFEQVSGINKMDSSLNVIKKYSGSESHHTAKKEAMYVSANKKGLEAKSHSKCITSSSGTKSSPNHEVNDSECIDNDLECMYDELLHEFNNLLKKYKHVKKECSKLSNELVSHVDCISLKTEYLSLKSEYDDL